MAEQEKQEEIREFVLFELDGEEYAVLITDINEIQNITEVVAIPKAPPYIEGVMNLRGRLVVVINLEKRFELTRTGTVPAKQFLLVASIDDSYLGVIVDSVKGILKVPASQVKKSSSLLTAKIHADFLGGVIVLPEPKGERLILVLNLRTLFEKEELRTVRTITRKAAL